MSGNLSSQLCLHDPSPPHAPDFIYQSPAYIERLNIVTASYALAIDQDIWNRSSARTLRQSVLDTAA